ncbi:unnamed protein product [Pocillopora meandrina]|uniref:Uncharacterized protein n=1 Tax=Pocillopora meandrina TaxID=46732 RepID=A0AAU9W5I3_9CNID|nr:unnamed protein product [Pocillopora meandrina]
MKTRSFHLLKQLTWHHNETSDSRAPDDIVTTVLAETMQREIQQSVISGPGEPNGHKAMRHTLRINHRVYFLRNRVAILLRGLKPATTK